MLTDQEMYTESPRMHVTTELQDLRLLWDALLHTRLGVRGLPGGGVPGGKGATNAGRSILKVKNWLKNQDDN